MNNTIAQLVAHVCEQPAFSEEAAFTGLERVIDYDWQKRLVLLLGRLVEEQAANPPVTQPWLNNIPLMQQTVLLTAIRGPDGLPKYGPVKLLLRWYRRCILLSAIDRQIIDNPYSKDGGSFTGPSLTRDSFSSCNVAEHWEEAMDMIVDGYMQALDALPHHFHTHLLHGVEILGYKHPDIRIREWWKSVYMRFVSDLHLQPETEETMDHRLCDSRENWLQHSDPSTSH